MTATTEHEIWQRIGDRMQIRSPKMITRRAQEGAAAPPRVDQIQATTMLIEDRIASDRVVASTTGRNQVAPFHNPFKGTAIESLVISSVLGKPDQLLYLASDPASATGWRLIPIKEGGDQDVFAREVITYPTTSGGVDAIYVGTGGTLRWMRIERDGWTALENVPDAPRDASFLGVAYSPGATSSSGVVCTYAACPDGSLFLQFRRPGSNWGRATIKGTGLTNLSSFRLTMGSETEWQIGYTRHGVPSEYIGGGQLSFDPPSAKLQWGPTQPGISAVRALGGLADQLYNGKPAGMLLYLDTANMFSWTCAAALYDPMSLPGAKFINAAVLDIVGDELTHVFGIDPELRLWAFFQDSKDFLPTNDPWSKPELLDHDIAKLYPPALAQPTPSFMALDSAGALIMYYQDPNTGFWAGGPVMYTNDNEYVVAKWRTEVVLYRNGTPMPYAELTVSAQSAVALSVGSECFFLESGTDAVLETDVLGKATFTARAIGTATPALTFSSPGITPLVYSPSEPVTSYLNGTGILPGWGDGVRDSFSADVLKNARVHGQPVVPAIQGTNPKISPDDATKMIRNTAALASPAALAALRAAGGPAGFMATKTDDGRMIYREFATSEELQAALAQRRAELGIAPAPEGIFDRFKEWVGDTWHAITKAASKVNDFFVDLGKKTVDFFVDVGNGIKKAFNWVSDTIEKAAEGVVAAFNWLESKMEDVIDWFKAVFDFKAIWNTKKAFSELMARFPAWLGTQLEVGGNYLQDKFFERMKGDITESFAKVKERFKDQRFDQQPKWQPMSVPPEDTSPVMGNASANDYSNNPKANWFTDKVASYEPDQLPAPSDDAWKNFGDAMQAAGKDFREALDHMATVLKTLMNPGEPGSFQNIVVPEFLGMIENVVTALVNLLDAVIQVFLGFGKVMAGELERFFTTPVSLGFVGTVYKWIAKLGGDSDPKDPTVADFFALLTAFPCTIVYKLINGSDTQPFPDGRLPPAPQPGAAPDLNSEQICLMCASIVKTLGLVPTLINDFDALKPAGSGKSSWASGVGIGITVISTVLAFEPTYVGFGPVQWGVTAVALVTAAQFAAILWAVGAISSLMKWKNANPDISAMGSSAFSVLMLSGSLVSDIYKDAKPLKYVTTVVKSISGIASFLLMKPVQGLLGGPEIAIPLKMGIDVTGYISGGILGTYLATDPEPAAL